MNKILIALSLLIFCATMSAQVNVQCPNPPASCDIHVTYPAPPPPPAGPTIAPLSLTFTAPLNSPSPIQVITITNPGTAAIPITYTEPAAPFSWGGIGTCGTTVPAKDKCTLSFKYTPTAAATATGSVTVTVAGKATTIPFTGSVAVQHGVLLKWDASAGSATYAMYRSETSGGPYAPNTSAPLTGTTYFDPSAQSGKTYYYVVRGVNDKGESTNSNEAKAVYP